MYIYIYIYIAKNTWNGTALIINELIIRREIFCHLKEVIRFFVFFCVHPMLDYHFTGILIHRMGEVIEGINSLPQLFLL